MNIFSEMELLTACKRPFYNVMKALFIMFLSVPYLACKIIPYILLQLFREVHSHLNFSSQLLFHEINVAILEHKTL